MSLLPAERSKSFLSFEDFGAPGAGEDGLKPGCMDVEIIFAWVLRLEFRHF